MTMNKQSIYCHLCRKELRDCGIWDGVWNFVCDDKTCTTDGFKIEVITKPAQQEVGSWLSVA